MSNINIDAQGILAQRLLSRTSFWRLRQLEDFPKPFTIPGLPRKLLWDQGEINRWFEKNRIPAAHGEPAQLRAAHGRLQQKR